MPAVLLVRHAQASFGAADYDVLSEYGHAQARAAAAELEARGLGRPAAIVTGGLRRQRDTAAPIAAALGVGAGAGAVRIDGRWDEYASDDILAHHADVPARLERAAGADAAPPLSSREFQAILEAALRRWIAAGADGPAAEPFPAFARRVAEALGALTGALGSGETAVVVTSGGVLAATCLALLGVADEAFVPLNRVAVNGAITKVAHGRSGTSLVSFNEHAHLERGGGPSLVTYR